jgi:hypothetical protein
VVCQVCISAFAQGMPCKLQANTVVYDADVWLGTVELEDDYTIRLGWLLLWLELRSRTVLTGLAARKQLPPDASS